MQQAERAELLVIGSRGHGRIFGALLGSVRQYLAAHAACPVVVIKPSPIGTVADPVRDVDALRRSSESPACTAIRLIGEDR